jgi:hypothetical protein
LNLSGLGQDWQTSLREHAEILGNFQRNSLQCRKLCLLAPYTGHGQHSSKFVICVVLFVILVVLLLIVMFYVLFVCKRVLPPGVNPIAVDEYINININININIPVYSSCILAPPCRLAPRQLPGWPPSPTLTVGSLKHIDTACRKDKEICVFPIPCM